MNELAGSVGTVTAIGMGTVFVCLVLLYGMTNLLRVLTSPRKVPEPETQPAADAGAVDEASEQDAGPNREVIVAAITVVLARHRAARMASATESGSESWKIAGRLRSLRVD